MKRQNTNLVYEIIGVDPKDFPPTDTLTKEKMEVGFNKLLDILKEHGINYGVSENVPIEVSYQYLVEDYILSEAQDLAKDFGWTIDGCSGDCPSCFQMDYCKSKDDTWSPEELKDEIKRREEGRL